MKRYSVILAAMAMLFAASCEKPADETPGKEDSKPELNANEYILDDEVHPFVSVAVSNVGEYLCIAASPAEGADTYEEIIEQDEFFYVAISPLLNGKEFDLMMEESLYTVISTLDGVELETVAPTMTEEIDGGICVFTYREGVALVEISLSLPDGSSFSAELSAEEPGIVVNENVFAIDGNEKPVRTAFCLLEDGMTALYLTPAGISYFDELPITTYYAYIMLDDSQCHGRTLSVSDVAVVGYADNFNEIVVDSNEVPTAGTLNVASDPDDPTHYIVSADLDFSGTSLKLRFDGSVIDAAAKEEVRNEIIYENKSYGIKEVWLDMMPSVENVCSVIIVTEGGKTMTINLPADFLDGNAHGFSQSKYLSIEFDGKIFSKAEGYSGTVTVGTHGDVMTIEATNYDNLEITYVGPYETAE